MTATQTTQIGFRWIVTIPEICEVMRLDKELFYKIVKNTGIQGHKFPAFQITIPKGEWRVSNIAITEWEKQVRDSTQSAVSSN